MGVSGPWGVSMLPLFQVNMSPTAKYAVAKVLESGYIGQGPKVEEFETKLEGLFGVRPLTTSGCTHALDLAYHMVHLSPDSHVISIPLTCLASNTPLINRYCIIRWADIDPLTGNIDPSSIEAILKDDPEIEAVVICDWSGRQNDVKRIKEIVGPKHIPVIEDAAHVFAPPNVPYPEDWYTAYSFGPIKHLTTGNGGALITPPEQRERGELLRWYGLDRKKTEICRCVHPRTMIRLVGKHSQMISRIVNEKNQGPVWCMEEGKLVPRKIVNWYINERGNRKYVGIYTKTRGSNFKSVVTEDHKILTPKGWIRAGSLKTGDKIYTSFPDMSKVQLELIIGSVMGDGYLTKSVGYGNKQSTNLVEGHSIREKEYVELKARCLKGLRTMIAIRPPRLFDKKPGYNPRVDYHTASLPCLFKLKKIFYPHGKKIVPRRFLKKNFSDMVLAIWFMDDGHTSIINQREGLVPICQLATNGFTKGDVEWLRIFLTKKGYACSLQKSSTCGWSLRFNKKGSMKLVEAISPYVLPVMRYKVGHLPHLRTFDDTLYGNGESPVFIDECIVEHPKYDYPCNQVYCIEVEGNHNFATTALIAHNCSEDCAEAGYKYHLCDLEATIGIDNFPYGIASVKKARENAKFYGEAFTDLKHVVPPPPDETSSWWLYVLKTPKRNEFMEFMKKADIMVNPAHRRNDIHSAFPKSIKPLPGVDDYDSKHCAIPVGFWVTESDRTKVVEKVKQWDSTLDKQK